jgi:hypothetical protein
MDSTNPDDRPGHDADSYDAGYAAGLHDAVFELAWPLVARSARLTDAGELSYALGRAIAVGESRQTAPPTPTNGNGEED